MRRLLDAFATALESLAEHKLRTTLTMLGMMFGVGAVIAMLSIGAGAERQALALIDRLGTRNVVVRGKTFKPEELEEIRKKSLGLSQRDVAGDRGGDPRRDVRRAEDRDRPVQDPRRRAARPPRPCTASAIATARSRRFALAEGRFLDAGDELHHAQVCVIGAGVRRDLFGADAALGKDVKINDVWCEVIGVLAPEPTAAVTAVQGVRSSSTEHEIYLPFTTALRKLDRDPMKAPLGEIVVRLDDARPGGRDRRGDRHAARSPARRRAPTTRSSCPRRCSSTAGRRSSCSTSSWASSPASRCSSAASAS